MTIEASRGFPPEAKHPRINTGWKDYFAQLNFKEERGKKERKKTRKGERGRVRGREKGREERRE